MKEFDRFFVTSNQVANVLLEELEHSSEKWMVTIGFDLGRTKMRQPNHNALAIFQDEIVPIREARRFIIDSTSGELLKIEAV